MRNLANHMLMITVTMVRVSHTGMKMFGRSEDVLETPVPPLKREGRNERAAKPNMIIVSSRSRRGEDFFPVSVPCDAS